MYIMLICWKVYEIKLKYTYTLRWEQGCCQKEGEGLELDSPTPYQQPSHTLPPPPHPQHKITKSKNGEKKTIKFNFLQTIIYVLIEIQKLPRI